MSRQDQREKQPYVIISRTSGVPTRSWWTEAPRTAFSQTCRAEAERMRGSKFGLINSLTKPETEK